MKLEVGSALAGWVAASGAALVHFGTSWPAVAMALVGAILAVLELEYRAVSAVARLFVFNFVAGVISAPVIVSQLELDHPAALVLFTFGVAYAGHDFFASARTALKAGFAKRLGAGK